MNKKNRNLQLSILHLHTIVTDLASIINALVEDVPISMDLLRPINKYIIIRTCAFYDEIDHQLLKHAKSKENRFVKFKKIHSYTLSKRDHYFPDMYKIRNYALAHNYRVKIGNDYHSIFEKQLHFIFPKSAAEISINIHLMDNFLSSVKWLYPEIYEVMNENRKRPTENIRSEIINGKNYQNIIADISNEIQRIANEE